MRTPNFRKNYCRLIVSSIHFFNKKKAETLEKEVKGTAGGGSERRQGMIRESKISETKNNLEMNKNQETALVARQEEISTSLTSAKQSLQKIYSENILPQKYRNLTAVATMYEYLEIGRCNTVQGYGLILKFDFFQSNPP